MRHIRLLFCAMFLAALGLSATHAAPAPAGKVGLVVKATTTGGIVWGWVTASWKNPQTKAPMKLTCKKQRCAWMVPAGVVVHVSQQAVDATTWPFSMWTIVGGGHTTHLTKASLNLTIKQKYTVTAVYVSV